MEKKKSFFIIYNLSFKCLREQCDRKAFWYCCKLMQIDCGCNFYYLYHYVLCWISLQSLCFSKMQTFPSLEITDDFYVLNVCILHFPTKVLMFLQEGSTFSCRRMQLKSDSCTYFDKQTMWAQDIYTFVSSASFHVRACIQFCISGSEKNSKTGWDVGIKQIMSTGDEVMIGYE